jgi:CubicO group peptidase (beta-lactamase class C family)
MDFGKYLDRYIFQPLGMKRSLVFRRRYEKKIPGNYALGYGWDAAAGKFVLPDSSEGVATMVYTLDGIVGDGTVNSTTNDLLKWDRALYTEKLVSKEMLEEAFSPAKLNDGKTFNYGFGWAIRQTYGGKMLSHSGGWPGYNTYMENHIENGKVIIVLRNHETGTSLPIQDIRKILYQVKDTVPNETALDAGKLAQYKGTYELVPGFSITVTPEENRIFAQATGQERFEIFPEKADMFFLKVVEAKIKFTRDAKGTVTGMILYQNGQEVEGVKK